MRGRGEDRGGRHRRTQPPGPLEERSLEDRIVSRVLGALEKRGLFAIGGEAPPGSSGARGSGRRYPPKRDSSLSSGRPLRARGEPPLSQRTRPSRPSGNERPRDMESEIPQTGDWAEVVRRGRSHRKALIGRREVPIGNEGRRVRADRAPGARVAPSGQTQLSGLPRRQRAPRTAAVAIVGDREQVDHTAAIRGIGVIFVTDAAWRATS